MNDAVCQGITKRWTGLENRMEYGTENVGMENGMETLTAHNDFERDCKVQCARSYC